MGRPDDAETLLQRSMELLGQVGDNYGLACAQLSLAELYSRRGEHGRGADLLATCRPVFERLGAALELARAQALEPAG